jgi:hypothetical protein
MCKHCNANLAVNCQIYAIGLFHSVASRISGQTSDPKYVHCGGKFACIYNTDELANGYGFVREKGRENLPDDPYADGIRYGALMWKCASGANE